MTAAEWPNVKWAISMHFLQESLISKQKKLLLKLVAVLAGTGDANMAWTLKYQLFLRCFLHVEMRHFVLVTSA